MDNKKLYKCVIEFEDAKLRASAKGASVIFFRSITMDSAILGARQLFNAECIKNNLQGVRYYIEAFPSTEKEVEDYKRGMQHRVN